MVFSQIGTNLYIVHPVCKALDAGNSFYLLNSQPLLYIDFAYVTFCSFVVIIGKLLKLGRHGIRKKLVI